MTRILALAILLPLAACDTGGPEAETFDPAAFTHDADALVGTWDLFRTTTAGFGAPVETASVTSGTEAYVFNADGTMERYREGALVEEAPYDVRELELVGNPLLHIGTEESYRRLFFGVSEDRFYIDYRPMDGSLYEYRRLGD